MEDNREEKRVIAEFIAYENGAVKRCEHHEDCILAVDDMDANGLAYKNAAHMFKLGHYDVFMNQRELTDEVKDVIDTACESCYSCDKF